MKNYEEVYNTWFGPGSLSDKTHVQQRMKAWFSKDPKFDAELRDKFGAWLTTPPDPAFQRWKIDRRGVISLVILHDQFPRQIFRGDARMFSWDGFALATAREALSHGIHESVSVYEAMFLLLPFEHSEKLSDQEESVQLFSDLRNRCNADQRDFGDEIFNYAVRHMEIIERFGRFPHRNETLGRKSSAAEIEFLQGPNSGF